MLYLRRERERKDEVGFTFWPTEVFKPGVLTRAYKNANGTGRVATWPVGQKQPNKNAKKVMLNCVKHDVIWLPDKI